MPACLPSYAGSNAGDAGGRGEAALLDDARCRLDLNDWPPTQHKRSTFRESAPEDNPKLGFVPGGRRSGTQSGTRDDVAHLASLLRECVCASLSGVLLSCATNGQAGRGTRYGRPSASGHIEKNPP